MSERERERAYCMLVVAGNVDDNRGEPLVFVHGLGVGLAAVSASILGPQVNGFDG